MAISTVTPITAVSPQLPSHARSVKLSLDNASYRAGSTVRFRVPPGEELWFRNPHLIVSVFRARESVPFTRYGIPTTETQQRTAYQVAWQIPLNALTGRYSISIEALDPESDLTLWKTETVSFAVWRSEIVIEDFDADRRFYAPGDPMSFTLRISNETSQRWHDLRLELGEAQYPWISGRRGSEPARTFPYQESLELDSHESRVVTITNVTAPQISHSSLHYTATLSSQESSSILAFRSTPAVFLRHPSETSQPVYPFSYMHSDLGQVRVEGYREFYPGETRRLSFVRNRSSYEAGKGQLVAIRFDRNEPFDRLLLELRDSEGELIDRAEVLPTGTSVETELQFGPPGLYRLLVYRPVETGTWRLTATEELGVNLLPRSLAIVCAHPDDEFLHPAIIRAAVENAVPVHIVFLTNGDAGGSDRFFGPGYTPAEAIEFGHIRMAEAVAAARHLGVPQDHLHFLGLPDGFLEAIRQHSEHTVFSPLLGADHSPYRGVRRPNLPFRHRDVVNALSEIMEEIDPDTVYTSHPDERHADHRAAGLFTIETLRHLVARRRLNSVPVIRTDEFYGPGNRTAEPFSYRNHELFSSGEAMARVQEAYWYYQTQGGNHARGNVLSYADLPRIERHREIVDWIR